MEKLPSSSTVRFVQLVTWKLFRCRWCHRSCSFQPVPGLHDRSLRGDCLSAGVSEKLSCRFVEILAAHPVNLTGCTFMLLHLLVVQARTQCLRYSPVAVAGLLFGILTPSIYLNMNAVGHVLDMEPWAQAEAWRGCTLCVTTLARWQGRPTAKSRRTWAADPEHTTQRSRLWQVLSLEVVFICIDLHSLATPMSFFAPARGPGMHVFSPTCVRTCDLHVTIPIAKDKH